MNSLKQRPLAVAGFTALLIMLLSIITGYIFESGAVCVSIGLVLIVAAVISKKLREVTVLFYLSAALIFSGVLLLANNSCSYEGAKALTGKDVNVVATVTADCSFTASRSTYILKTETVSGEELKTKLRLTSNTSLGACPGDKISFVSDVYSIDFFSNSLKRYYMSEGIYLGTSLYDAQNNIKIISENPNSIENKLFTLRNTIKSGIFKYLPNEYGGIAVGMLLGDMSSVSDETVDNFRLTGITHLFAVSGLHLSVWVMGIFQILEKLGVKKKINSLISIFFILFIMLLTGLSPSINRAGIMLICLMWGNFINRRSDPVNSLGLSLIILLAVNPMCAASVSLLLSVMATLGIVTLYSKIDKYLILSFENIKLSVIRKPILSLISAFLVSAVASIFTLPVNVFSFGQLSLIAPITNVLVSYPSTLLMILSGFVAVFSKISWLAKPLSLISGLCGRFIVEVSDALSKIPNAVIKTDNIILEISLIFFLFSLVCCFIIFNTRLKRIKSVIAVTLCTVIACSTALFLYSHNLTKVQVLDVDDGICIVAENSGNKIVLGSGGSDEYALTDIKSTVFTKDASMLLIPDNNQWNSSFALDLSKSFKFEKIVSGEENSYVKTQIVKDFKINPWHGSSVSFHHGDDITYAYCVFGDTDMLIVFNSDTAPLPKKYLKSDILICSYYLPENTDVSGFSNIIISSTDKITNVLEKNFSKYNQNIYSTSGIRDVILELRNEKNTKIIYN